MFLGEKLRAFSYGGGVQSTAVLVLAARGELQYDALVFANVGDDSEHPETLDYLREVAWPYAERHGIRLEEISRRRRDGTIETLYGRMQAGNRGVTIPAVVTNKKGERARVNRQCTYDFKVDIIHRWLKRNGATAAAPAVQGLGISTDEWQRARTESGAAWVQLEYPLLDRRLSRTDCVRIIESAGLPVPPKSACWFCPFQTTDRWRMLKRNHLDLFTSAVALERQLDTRAERWHIRPLRLTGQVGWLDDVVAGDQLTFDDLGECDEGVCWT